MRNLAVLLSTALVLSACGTQKAIDATRSMPGKMDDMINKTNHLNQIVDLQAEMLPFEGLLKPEYGRDLAPIPFDLMPYAKKFAQYAPAEDIPELVYVWVKKLNEAALDPTTGETQDQFLHRKMQTLAALQAVCGFLPHAKVKQIINSEIYHSGRHQTAALQVLMLRVRFLRDVLLEASLFSAPMDSVGALQKAVEYNDEIDFIARLPFAGDIAVTITGFPEPVQEAMDTKLALTEWQKIKLKANRSLKVEPKVYTGIPAQDQALYQQQYNLMVQNLKLVDDRISSWGAKP
jgi:hypothetical protein